MKPAGPWRALGLAGLGLLLGGCAFWGREPPATAGALDLERYQGTWYEQARLPVPFQSRCLQSEAHYRLLSPGVLAVSNRCRTAAGEWLEASGTARPLDRGRTDRLWVRFHNVFGYGFPVLAEGDYWVLYIDPDYRLALVGSPDREFLWILSRETTIAPQDRERLLKLARERGYDLELLIWRPEDAEPSAVAP